MRSRDRTKNSGVRRYNQQYSVTPSPGRTESVTSRSGNTVELDLDDIKNWCSQLVAYAEVDRLDLEDEQHEVLMNLVKIGRQIYGTESYASFHRVVVSVFGNYRNAAHGTVANYLVGPLSDEPVIGKAGCGSKSAGNLPLPEGPGWDICDSHVALYDSGILTMTHETPEPCNHVIIHRISEKGDVVLSEEQYEDLRNLGIRQATIVKHYNGVPHYAKEPAKLESFLQVTKKCKTDDKKDKKEEEKKDEDDNWWWIAAVVIFIIIILVAVALIYCWGRPSYATASVKNTNNVEVC